MCRIPKVLIVAPSEMHSELKRKLASYDYDIVATLEPGEASGVSADVAVVWEPDVGTIATLRAADMKVAAFGGPGGADLDLDPADPTVFKRRIWDLLRVH